LVPGRFVVVTKQGTKHPKKHKLTHLKMSLLLRVIEVSFLFLSECFALFLSLAICYFVYGKSYLALVLEELNTAENSAINGLISHMESNNLCKQDSESVETGCDEFSPIEDSDRKMEQQQEMTEEDLSMGVNDAEWNDCVAICPQETNCKDLVKYVPVVCQNSKSQADACLSIDTKRFLDAPLVQQSESSQISTFVNQCVVNVTSKVESAQRIAQLDQECIDNVMSRNMEEEERSTVSNIISSCVKNIEEREEEQEIALFVTKCFNRVYDNETSHQISEFVSECIYNLYIMDIIEDFQQFIEVRNSFNASETITRNSSFNNRFFTCKNGQLSSPLACDPETELVSVKKYFQTSEGLLMELKSKSMKQKSKKGFKALKKKLRMLNVLSRTRTFLDSYTWLGL
jgi:hypothetical protein